MKLLGALILSFVAWIFEGYVLMTMWGWFIVSTFNLPTLKIPVAIGIILICNLLTHQHEEPIKEGEHLGRVCNSLCLTIIIFGLGFITKLFI